MEDLIYLDHNATTPLAREVAAVMAVAEVEAFANPESQHEPGRRARRLLEEARHRCLQLLGASTRGHRPDRLVFTSGGTEANNLAIRGLAFAAAEAASPPHQIIVSAIEHPSVSAVADALATAGWQVDSLPVDRQGVVEPDALGSLLSSRTRLVSVMLGNNETGVVQPVAELAAQCRAAGVAFHTDAVQAVAKVRVSFADLGVTAMTFTAHKFHGPAGIGGLLVHSQAVLKPLFYGGFQQAGLRPGTPTVALAVGLRTALEMWHAEAMARESRLRELRDRLEQRVLQTIPGAVVVGDGAIRLPHTSNIAFPGVDRQALVMALDLAGVACSTGSACASGSSEPSPVLVAMGCPDEVVSGSIRLSLGAETTAEEVDQAASRISRVYNQLRRQKGR